MNFFSQNIEQIVLNLKIQLNFSILWLWHLNISSKSKTWSKNVFFFCLLELLPQKNQKSAKMGLELKKLCGFFWLKSKTANTKKLKLDIQSSYKLWEFSNDPLIHGGNLDPIWAQKTFLGSIFQEFCDFSGTLDLRYYSWGCSFCRNLGF